MILTELWVKRLFATGLVVHAMHPGWADTPGVAPPLPRDRRRRPPRGVPWTRETPDRERPWPERERFTGRHADPVPAATQAHT
jgi:hypothetical protein